MSPLTAAVHFIDSDPGQPSLQMALLKLSHEAFALGNLLWSDVKKTQWGVIIQHGSIGRLQLQMTNTK